MKAGNIAKTIGRYLTDIAEKFGRHLTDIARIVADGYFYGDSWAVYSWLTDINY